MRDASHAALPACGTPASRGGSPGSGKGRRPRGARPTPEGRVGAHRVPGAAAAHFLPSCSMPASQVRPPPPVWLCAKAWRALAEHCPVPGPAHAWGTRRSPPAPMALAPAAPELCAQHSACPAVTVPSHDCYSFCAEMSPSATRLWSKRNSVVTSELCSTENALHRSLRKSPSVLSFPFLSGPFLLVWFLTAVESGLYKDCLLTRTVLKINGRPLSLCSR